MKKLAILIAIAALSACSDSSEGQAPADAGTSTSDKSVVAAPAENTTTPKTDALPSADNSAAASDTSTEPAEEKAASASADPALVARRAQLGPQFAAARDAFREARTQLRDKRAELENAVAANSPDVDRIRQETEALTVAFNEARNEFTPLYEEWVALTNQIDEQRSAQ